MKLLNKVLFYILWGFVKLFGLLPTKIHYIFSDLIFYVLRYIFKYRLSVVRGNLKSCFPNKSDKEIHDIEIKFYHHLADIFVETLLISSISEKELDRRMVFEGKQQMEDLVDCEGRILVAAAHYCSWEYTIIYGADSIANVYGIYHPLSSEVMERYYLDARSRFGSKPLPMSKIAKQIVNDKKDDIKSLYLLIADQTPPKSTIKHWLMFLDRPTAFFDGMEKLALKYKMPILFLDMHKVKRGYYRSTVKVIYDGKEQVEPYDITKRYVAYLEEMIDRDPHLWLWSHRRWKHVPQSDEQIVR